MEHRKCLKLVEKKKQRTRKENKRKKKQIKKPIQSIADQV